jgi:putative ABC transport system permease protein
MGDKKHRIPGPAAWLLNRILPSQEILHLNGSFECLYSDKVRCTGRLRAGIWIWGEILKSLPGFFYAAIYWRLMMLKNYVLITFRNIRKHAVFSGINIFGLSLGMAVCLLIFLWVQNEFRYDRFHENGADIAQVYSELEYSEGSRQIFTGSYYPLAQVLRDECPEVSEAARYLSTSGMLIGYGKNQFRNDTVALVDASFFKIFTFPFIAGSPDSALEENNSVVLTETMARKYFGNEDPIGKILTVDGSLDIQVTGVIQDVPSRSSLQFDCIVPFVLAFAPKYQEPEHWGGNPLQTYILLNKNSDHELVEQKITAVAEKHMNPETVKVSFHMFPLKRLHLFSPQGGGLIQYVLIFSAIALFVLLIACINFTNLSTATAATRAKEVGMRKVVGARKTDLVWQFIGESMLISFITLVTAVGLLALFLPVFNRLLGKQLSLNSLLDPVVIFGFLSIAMLTGMLAGLYPALYLSSFQPQSILRGLIRAGISSALRKVLVVCQFSLSIILMICTLVIFRQLGFMMHADLGFERENLVVLQMNDGVREQYGVLKNELLQSSHIRAVTNSLQGPWNIGSTVSAVDWDGKSPDENVNLYWDNIDYDYFDTFGMEILEGRSFSRDYSTDSSEAYIVNQEAVKLMGMDSPVGKWLSVFRQEGRIIGVVKNFHFQPLYHEIKPFVFMLRPNSGSLAFVRIKPENISGTLDYIRSSVSKFVPDSAADPVFFNDILKNYIYTAEQQTGQVAGYFASLAVVISCMGLFGLAAFMAERRTKEIGIRKVVGASAREVVAMLSRDFSRWVLLSNVFAWPVAYLVARKMLERYAFRVGINLGYFVLPGLAAFIIALLTVSYQAFKAARANPADSLRYE